MTSRRVGSADGKKANLLATVGPSVEGGVVLSGHTDVVPVKGQPWTSDPFVLTRRDDKLFGRGTCDMKGFIALALAAVPDILAADPARPAHLAFSYDEEIGCLGAPAMIEVIAREVARPRRWSWWANRPACAWSGRTRASTSTRSSFGAGRRIRPRPISAPPPSSRPRN